MTDLVQLAKARNSASAKVRDWMASEGAKGNLRQNSHAPAWPEYEKAQKDLDAALWEVGFD